MGEHATTSNVTPGSEAARQRDMAGRGRSVHGMRARAFVIAAFSVLGLGLAWSRLVGLDQSMWHDEIYTVVHYVRPGPRAIFGDYVPNDHMLYELLTWATSSVLGQTEVVYRLWSVVPFIAGVILVGRWLKRLDGLLAAGLYVLLATASPLLIDWSRQARGYGLAFFAMSLLTIYACQIVEDCTRSALLLYSAAGVIGSWDLPIFGVTFAAVSLVLLAQKPLRRRALPWLCGSLAAVLLWYLPVVGELLSSSRQEYGRQLSWPDVLYGPFTQLLAPSVIPNGDVRYRGLAAVLVFVPALVIGIRVVSRRSRAAAGTMISGVVGTYLVLWVGRFFVEDRFVSYLLVPLFVLVGVGVAGLVRALGRRRSHVRIFGTALLVLGAGWICATLLSNGLLATRYPLEAYKNAAAAIDARLPGATVVANLPHPDDLRYYLRRPIVTVPATRLEAVVCRTPPHGLIYVEQPFRTPPIDLACLRRAGATHQRFVQYTRGDRIDVWFRP
jgi:hypothetical protein